MIHELKNEVEIIDAINDYSDFSTNQKKIFALLVSTSINNVCKMTINHINEKTKATRATISHTLSYLKENNFIKVHEYKGNRFTGCDIVQSRLHEILLHYKAKK